jgi:MFS family permease
MVLTRDWRYTVGVVTGGHAFSHFYLLVFPPVFPQLRAVFGLSNTEFGLLMSVISIGLFLQLPVGSLVDRWGAKHVFVGGTALTAVGVLIAGFATSYAGLLAGAVVSGVGQAAFHPADYALLGAVASEAHEGKSFSVHTFGAYLGFGTAPLAVGGIAARTDWSTALLTVGAAGVVYAAFAALTLDPAYRRKLDGAAADAAESNLRDAVSSLVRPTVLLLFAFFVVLTMGAKGVQTFTTVLVVDAYGLAEAVGNTALTAFFVGSAAGVLAGGVVADRLDPRRVIVVSLAVGGGLLFLLAGGVAPVSPPGVAGGFGLTGLAVGLAYPSRDRLVSRYAPSDSTGTSFGFVFTGIALGGLVSPVLLGAVTDATAVTVAFVLAGGFYLLAGGVALAVGYAPTGRETPRAAHGD